jgi:hypothetical protein
MSLIAGPVAADGVAVYAAAAATASVEQVEPHLEITSDTLRISKRRFIWLTP